MADNPFYYLRPNKCIDRYLFLQTLLGLNKKYKLGNYQYTGFGSYTFDDFKLLHTFIGIEKMVSLESDSDEFQRACYNKPFQCIEILNENSTEYLTNLTVEDDEHNIIWLDYTTPNELGVQLSDYSTILNKLNSGDVIRITLNANPDGLGKVDDPEHLQEHRLSQFKKRVSSAYWPADINKECVTKKKYPLLLLDVLKSVVLECFQESPESPNFFLPLFATVYADGQQMLTFTGLILDDHGEEASIRDALSNLPFVSFKWREPASIDIPTLTIKEISQLNSQLPDEGKFAEGLDFLTGNIENYKEYYKYYPNYMLVNF